MGLRGPKPVTAQQLHLFANEFYWAFRALGEGTRRLHFDGKFYGEVLRKVDREVEISDANRRCIAELLDQEIQEGRLKDSERGLRLRALEADYLFMERSTQYE